LATLSPNMPPEDRCRTLTWPSCWRRILVDESGNVVEASAGGSSVLPVVGLRTVGL
jgi:hypothetical protein